jgi:hypothetical protein
MNTKCHFIPHTVHYAGVYSVLTKMPPITANTLLQLGSQVSQCLPHHNFAIIKICLQITILKLRMVHGLLVTPPKGNNHMMRDQANVQAL